MNRELYTEKFVAYANSFLTEDEDHNYHIILKREHTLRVARLCDKIIESEEAVTGQDSLPYLAGLFHDIGRFEQFKQYQSFHDATTVDHGLLGKQILESEALLEGLSDIKKSCCNTRHCITINWRYQKAEICWSFIPGLFAMLTNSISTMFYKSTSIPVRAKAN